MVHVKYILEKCCMHHHGASEQQCSHEGDPHADNCNCNLDTPTRRAGEDIQYMHKIILEERGRE